MTLLMALCVAVAAAPSAAQDAVRIKRKPPSAAEADRIAAEMAMNDSLLRKGDIVATDRGFLMFRGVAADGYTYEFEPIKSPIPLGRK